MGCHDHHAAVVWALAGEAPALATWGQLRQCPHDHGQNQRLAQDDHEICDSATALGSVELVANVPGPWSGCGIL